VIPTNEELMIARHTQHLLERNPMDGVSRKASEESTWHS